MTEQAKSTALAADKSEISITKQLDQINVLIKTANDSLKDSISDIKERLTKIESLSIGQLIARVEQHEVRKEQGMSQSWVLALVMAAVSVVGLIVTLIVVFGRGPMPASRPAAALRSVLGSAAESNRGRLCEPGVTPGPPGEGINLLTGGEPPPVRAHPEELYRASGAPAPARPAAACSASRMSTSAMLVSDRRSRSANWLRTRARCWQADVEVCHAAAVHRSHSTPPGDGFYAHFGIHWERRGMTRRYPTFRIEGATHGRDREGEQMTSDGNHTAPYIPFVPLARGPR